MLIPILPQPTKIDTPTVSMASSQYVDVEIARAVDVSQLKSGVLALRIHDNALPSYLKLNVIAFATWPIDSGRERYEDTGSQVLATSDANLASGSGILVRSSVASLGAPYVRIVARFTATANVTTGGSITISLGFVGYDA